MKKNWIFYLIIALFISLPAFPQKNKIYFHSINSFEIIGGESKVRTGFQTVNGIQFSKWFTGIGIGVDNYRYKTLPLFFDTRKYFGKKNNAFAYGDLGYDFAMKNKPGKEILYYGTYKFSGGIYTDLGLGYKWKLIKKTSFLLSAGYSYKKIFDKIGTSSPVIDCAPGVACPLDYSKYNYGLGRIVLKAGVDF